MKECQWLACLSTLVRELRDAHAIVLWKAHDLRALSKTFFSKQTALGLALLTIVGDCWRIADDMNSRCGRAEFLASSGLSVAELEVAGRNMNL
jgi:hypothetical protein